MNNLKIDPLGLGHILLNRKLSVPIYQRSYAWEKEQVRQLLDDLSRAMRRREQGKLSQYFLGSVVVIPRPDGRLEIVDGQQRLATASLIITAIRDWYRSIDDKVGSEQCERYLQETDLRTRLSDPNLTLNEIDNVCYLNAILGPPGEPKAKRDGFTESSHEKLFAAYDEIRERIETIAKTGDRRAALNSMADWLEYIKDNAKVVQVSVENDADAFTIFETLNDRGIDLTIADLLKNYLFGLAGKMHLDAVRTKWDEMRGSLKALGKKDRSVDFIRQLWGSERGIIRGPNLFSDIREAKITERDAIEFASNLAASAVDYAAILRPDADLWDDYSTSTRNSVKAIRIMRIERLRPLMLAIMRSFAKNEAIKSFLLLEAVSARIVIAGGPAGTIEQEFFEAAKKVHKKEITKAEQLLAELKSVPSDFEFEAKFRGLSVHIPKLARYYLQTLEDSLPGAGERTVLPDERRITLEHIIPQKDLDEWGYIPKDKAPALSRRLGNMALMLKKDNNQSKSLGYDKKKAFLAATANYKLTNVIPEKWPSDRWGETCINERQLELAKLAVNAWPLKVPKI